MPTCTRVWTGFGNAVHSSCAVNQCPSCTASVWHMVVHYLSSVVHDVYTAVLFSNHQHGLCMQQVMYCAATGHVLCSNRPCTVQQQAMYCAATGHVLCSNRPCTVQQQIMYRQQQAMYCTATGHVLYSNEPYCHWVAGSPGTVPQM